MFGVIVNTEVLPEPTVPLLGESEVKTEKVTLSLIVKLLNVISGFTVSVKLLFPEALMDAGTPNPCTDNSFVSILDDVVVSPNILLNLKFSFSLKNLTLPVCWSVVIEFAYHPFVSVSVKVAICSGVYPLASRTLNVVPVPKDGVKVKLTLLAKLTAEDKIKLF